MGTSYYLVMRARDMEADDDVDLDAPWVYHIGKRSHGSAGLAWSLRAHTDFLGSGMAIGSWCTWKAVLRAVPRGQVINEYLGPVDIGSLITLVDSTEPLNRRRTFDWLLERSDDALNRSILDDMWLDDQGFEFTRRYFS